MSGWPGCLNLHNLICWMPPVLRRPSRPGEGPADRAVTARPDRLYIEALGSLESLPAGGLVIAAEQVSGRGRRGRCQPHGCNLYVPGRSGILSAVSRLWRGWSLAVEVRWPMRLSMRSWTTTHGPTTYSIGGGKLGGILIETAGHASGRASAVVGIGVTKHVRRRGVCYRSGSLLDRCPACGRLESGRNQLLGRSAQSSFALAGRV